MGYEQDVRALRDKIDDIDAQLVPLFESRMRASDGIAAVKQRYGMPVFDAGRENAVIDRALSRLADAGNGEALRRFFRALMDLSKQRQHAHITPADPPAGDASATGFLGLRGSFSHIAAREAFGGGAPLKSYDTFEDMFEALRRGEIGRAILPAENTETGSITAVVDLLARYGYFIVAERLLKVAHSLLGLPDATLAGIERVFSHPEPIAQCSAFLREHPRIGAYPALSTAQAAMSVAAQTDAAVGCIASMQAAKEYGLKVLAENIQNSQGNSTRFVVVARQPVLTPACDKTSIVFKVEHRPGSLCDMLRLFSGINILKLESRPLRDRPFEYLFHLDFEGSAQDDRVKRVLEDAKNSAADLVWLGSYPRMAL